MERIPRGSSPKEIRSAFQQREGRGDIITQGAAGEILVGVAVGSLPVWGTELTALTLLTIDNITIDGATITSDTGAISFVNENLTTTGTIAGVNVTSGLDPGHRHSALSASDGTPADSLALDVLGRITSTAAIAGTAHSFTLKNEISSSLVVFQLENDTLLHKTDLRMYGTAHGGTLAGVSTNDMAAWVAQGDVSTLMFLTASPTTPILFATNVIVRATITGSGDFGIGVQAPDARFEVETAADEGHQAITIDQNDVDQAFVDFQGTSAASVANNISSWTGGNSIQGFTRQEVNGAVVWMPFYDAPTAVAGIDHGALSGLGDDDHTQYHTDARGDARYYTETELDAGQLDNRYFTEAEHLDSSAGAADSGKPIKLDAGGHVDSTMINDADIDHGALGGLGDDDHTIYSLADGTRNFSGVVVGVDPTASNHLATKEYVDSAISFIEEFFLTDTASGIGSYFNMVDQSTGEAESSDPTGSITQTDGQALTEWITAVGVPGVTSLEHGIYSAHVHVEKTGGGARDVQIYFEVHTRTHPGGAETLRVTSEISGLITSKGFVNLHATLAADVAINATDRLVIKFFANGVSGGNNATITLYSEGTTSSHFSVPISSEVLSTIFLRQDGTKALTGNMAVDPGVTIDGRDIRLDGQDLDTLVSIIGKVKIDTNATVNYLGAAYNDGALRTSTGISYADGGDFVTLTTNDGEIVHDNLSGYDSNDHIDHTSVSVSSGSGLTGGGTIDGNQTLALDINGLSVAVIAAGDFIPFWDITATATNKKITFANLEGTLTHDNLSGFGTDNHHAESHNAASHSDITAAGASIDAAVTNSKKVGVDAGATADYLGAAFNDGALRTGTGISYADGGNFVTLTTNDGEIAHDSLSGYDANDHIDHTTITLTAGSGITGGGTIATNRIFDLDINGLAVAVIAAGDFVPFWDITAVATNKKITFANFEGTLAHDNLSGYDAAKHLTLPNTITNVLSDHDLAAHTALGLFDSSGDVDHDTTTNYDANDHIDHTTVSVSSGSGLTGGGTINGNQTLALDINGLAVAVIATGDFVPFWDITATATNKKITFSNFEAALTHDNLISGTIADHDTTATGANLTSLTDNSMVDALHRHSELSASDGSPDASLTIDTIGQVTSSGNVAGQYAFTITNTNSGGLTTLVLENDTTGHKMDLRMYGTAHGGTLAGISTNDMLVWVAQSDISTFMFLTANPATPIVFATNIIERARITGGGDFGINSTPDARFEVETEETEGHQAVTIDQNDVDQAFIDFQGSSAASAANNITTWTTGNSIQGFTRQEVNGAVVWMPYYDAPTS